ncbi:MAG TPA: sugar ABC transporter permease [Chthonomonadaceae bacterium]|nr:sugar ABC transporter permease [Chthonomonadaceae bacterium]
MKKNWVGYAFISPWIIGFLVFTLYPFLASFYFAFTRYDIVSPPHWVGMTNYRMLFTTDPQFWKALGVTFRFAACAVPLGVVLGVGLALLLNLNLRGMSLFRTIFYLPSIVPTIATAFVFLWILNPEIGLVNRLLKNFGIEGPAWLQDTAWAPWSLVLMSLWGVGGSMVIYLAGLKDIPTHLYEAAIIDGASPFQRLRHITLPMLTPVIFFNVVMGVIGAFQYFTEAYVMTRGGPEDSTLFYALYLFQRAWRYLDMGYASAMAWILFLVVMVLTSLIFRSQRRWVHYEG